APPRTASRSRPRSRATGCPSTSSSTRTGSRSSSSCRRFPRAGESRGAAGSTPSSTLRTTSWSGGARPWSPAIPIARSRAPWRCCSQASTPIEASEEMSRDAILVLNAGSSSIKLAVFAERAGELALELRGEVEGLYTDPRFRAHDPAGRVLAEKSWGRTTLGHDGAVEYLGDFLQHHLADHRLVAVGHRVVHGGLEYTAPVRVEPATLKALERLIPLAPLHQPHNLAPIAPLLERAPDLPQVACFDTSFHRTNPDVAQRFALPAELHDAGVQRYGFHGLSYEYIAAEFPRVDAKAAAAKTIV